jgi:hypothetical protein
VVAAACSRVRNVASSWMVLISGAGNTTVVFLSTPSSISDWTAAARATRQPEACSTT